MGRSISSALGSLLAWIGLSQYCDSLTCWEEVMLDRFDDLGWRAAATFLDWSPLFEFFLPWIGANPPCGVLAIDARLLSKLACRMGMLRYTCWASGRSELMLLSLSLLGLMSCPKLKLSTFWVPAEPTTGSTRWFCCSVNIVVSFWLSRVVYWPALSTSLKRAWDFSSAIIFLSKTLAC